MILWKMAYRTFAGGINNARREYRNPERKLKNSKNYVDNTLSQGI